MNSNAIPVSVSSIRNCIDEIKLLSEQYGLGGDEYRNKAYMTAATELESLEDSKLLAFVRDVIDNKKPNKVRGVGESTMARIREYFNGKQIVNREFIEAARVFSKIYGVGPATSAYWAGLGAKSIKDVLRLSDDGTIELTDAQVLGITYRESMGHKLTRAKAEEIFNTIAPVFGESEKIEMVGSYRRGKSELGDIDILVTTSTNEFVANLNVLRGISGVGRLLTFVSMGDDKVAAMWIYPDDDGVSKIVMVDILRCDRASHAAALLYFTGSAQFNIAMREKAKNKGYLLSHTGLYSGSGARLVKTKTEKEIFDVLGEPYVDPEHRY